MKIQALFCTLACSLAMSSARAGIFCSDTAGDLKYTEGGYMSGVPPQEGMEVGRSTWTLGGKIIGVSIQKYLQPATKLPFEVKFAANRIEVASEENASAIVKYYAVKIMLQKASGEVVASERYIFCQDFQSKVHPP